MRSVKEMIREQSLWAGLNRPGIERDEADIVVFGIPYDGGVSFRSGAKEGPRAIREITYTIAPTTERWEDLSSLQIMDLGDLEGSNRQELFQQAEEAAFSIVKSGKLLTMIGGDHSTTIPVMRGINRAVDEPFGIIHIDAHFDLCHEMGGDYFSHGSTERRALELENVPDTESIFFVGIRSVESEELAFIQENRMNIIGAMDVRQNGIDQTLKTIKTKMSRFKKIYMTIDIDSLDPAYAPGTGTPQFGGLNSRELLNLLYGLFDLPIIGFDVVEVSPKLDDSLITAFAARKILTECWGHHHRKKEKIQENTN
ncbi:agmatinase [Scopulibacillus darangshiensis]|uniref:Agmatinase n=1 Tax=Scopulibacillus darangshiensis TaxID=442528 RepID=A0A4R2NKS9_9BACL|nr:agmatinase [Scopulibacillus darangshiensis]TCP21865.1 agmatinase [Scopulibacillus darangshiensis]